MLFASLHSSNRKFATAQYVNKERFLSPYLYSLFVICSSARATSTVFCSLFVRSLFVLCSFFVRSLFVLCSSFVRLLFVLCSSFVRLSFVICSSFVRLLFICLSCYDCLCGSHLPVVLRPRTVINFGVIGIIGTVVLVAHLLT